MSILALNRPDGERNPISVQAVYLVFSPIGLMMCIVGLAAGAFGLVEPTRR